MNRARTTNSVLTSAIVFLAAAASVHADVISPGFDYFTSNDANGDSLGSAVDLSAFGLGVVQLKGAPFGIHGFDSGERIDTVVRRKQGIDPFDWPDGTGTIDIELVALHLVSVEPIDLGGGFFADLHTIVNRYGRVDTLPTTDAIRRSLGGMRIRHETEQGGTFDSIFGAPGDEQDVPPELADLLVPRGGVTARAYLTFPGSDPIDPNNWLAQPFDANRLVLWSLDSTWEHSPYGFTDFQVTHIEHDCGFPECHPVDPVIPAAPTLALLGVAGLAGTRRRR